MGEALPHDLSIAWVDRALGAGGDPGDGSLVGAESRLLPVAGGAAQGLVLTAGTMAPVDGVRAGVGGQFNRRSVVWAPGWTPGETGSAYLLCVLLYVPRAAAQDDCRRWLDDEHADRQLSVDGANWYGGYESVRGDFAFANLWGIDDPAVIETPEWAQARDTPWRFRLLDSIVRTERALFVLDPTIGERQEDGR